LRGRFLNPRAYYITYESSISALERVELSTKREYPDSPVVGVGGVVIRDGRTLLIRRGSPPLMGEWSIPGGRLDLGETIPEGIKRELKEETGIDVRVVELIEVFERIFRDSDGRIQYHFVIVDYLCEYGEGEACAGSDVTDTAWASESELVRYSLTETATRVIRRAFKLAASRDLAKSPPA
jgi:8-oxo-dGTP diphosphatase